MLREKVLKKSQYNLIARKVYKIISMFIKFPYPYEFID